MKVDPAVERLAAGDFIGVRIHDVGLDSCALLAQNGACLGQFLA